MDTDRIQNHITFLRQAIHLAREAEENGNLPIGAVLVLDGNVVAKGKNSIWKPKPEYTRHAEMEALRATPAHLWPRSEEMTIFTTLEPCLMCAGALLLHRVGRVIFGASDPYGGVSASLDSLPPFFREVYASVHWDGPALSSECDPLYERARELERLRR